MKSSLATVHRVLISISSLLINGDYYERIVDPLNPVECRLNRHLVKDLLVQFLLCQKADYDPSKLASFLFTEKGLPQLVNIFGNLQAVQLLFEKNYTLTSWRKVCEIKRELVAFRHYSWELATHKQAPALTNHAMKWLFMFKFLLATLAQLFSFKCLNKLPSLSRCPFLLENETLSNLKQVEDICTQNCDFGVSIQNFLSTVHLSCFFCFRKMLL